MRRPVREEGTELPGVGPAGLLTREKPFIVVWLALFISIAGIAMVTPLLPVFAQDMGASGIWLGLAFSGFAITQVPLMPLVGRLSDRFGKKFFLWSGLLIFAMAAMGYIWAPGYHELVLFRLLSGVGAAMVIPTAFAYVGDLAPYGKEGRYMGLFNIALIAGFGVGPALGGVVYDGFGMDATFASMVILSISGCLIVLLLLPKAKSATRVTLSDDEAARSQEPSNSFISILRDETMRGIITFQLTFGVLFGTVLSFLGIWMTTGTNTSVGQVGIVLSARVITNAIFAYPFGRLADSRNRIILASTGLLMVATGTFCIPWLQDFAPLLFLFMAIGLFESLAMPSVTAVNVEKGRDLGMGSVMGVFNMANSLGLVTGSLMGGMIQSSVGLVEVFRYAAIFSFVGVGLFVFFMRKRITQ